MDRSTLSEFPHNMNSTIEQRGKIIVDWDLGRKQTWLNGSSQYLHAILWIISLFTTSLFYCQIKIHFRMPKTNQPKQPIKYKTGFICHLWIFIYLGNHVSWSELSKSSGWDEILKWAWSIEQCTMESPISLKSSFIGQIELRNKY